MQNFPLEEDLKDFPQALESLAALAAFSGPALLQKVTDWLFERASQWNAAGVVVGDIHGAFGDQIKVRAISGVAGLQLESYSLAGMPCLEVIQAEDTYQVHINLSNLDPDNLFAKLEVQEYIGHPLRNSYGRPIGVMCVLARELTDSQRAQLDRSLGWLAPRVSKELSSLRRDEVVRRTSTWLAQSSTEAILRELCVSSASALQVSTAFVLSKADGQNTELRMLAHGGEILEELLGTDLSADPGPLSQHLTVEQTFHRSGVTQMFANSKLVSILGMDSYLAFPLTDPDNQVIGHLGWAHRGPMSDILPLEETLEVFRASATAELLRERQTAERKRMVAALQTKDRLESLGLMAGAIAHDFNNLLVSIIGNTNLAMDVSSDEAIEFLQRVEQASVQAGDIVNQLLAYAGKHQDELRLANLNEVVVQSVELLGLSGQPRITTHLALMESIAPVWADPTRLQQAVMNLILNAQESFADHGGTIQLHSRECTLTRDDLQGMRHGYEADAGDFVEFGVEDNGSGMSAEIIERMFDPFYTSKELGQGLGLATLLGFAKAHRGAIDVRSEVGVGSHISLFLPRAEQTEPAVNTPADHPDRRPLPGLPVLVVDDEEGVRTVMQRLLESVDYQVETASSGQEAMDLIASGRRYALAVIDIAMPGRNGWETLDAIRALQTDLPIIMMSGYTEEDSAAKEAQRQGARFLPKPFRRAELETLINRTVGRDRPSGL
ncbi:MAG: response regulator [Pseudomonadota bacterium]